MNIILKRPIISEKSMKLTQGGWYTFLVDKRARKPAVTAAVEKVFGVNVLAIKTANLAGKQKMQRSRKGYFVLPGYKKVVVKLKKGQSIGLFETPKEEEVVVTTAEGEPVMEVKEKKSLLKGTKVRIEKSEQKKDLKRKKKGEK